MGWMHLVDAGLFLNLRYLLFMKVIEGNRLQLIFTHDTHVIDCENEVTLKNTLMDIVDFFDSGDNLLEI